MKPTAFLIVLFLLNLAPVLGQNPRTAEEYVNRGLARQGNVTLTERLKITAKRFP